MNYKPQHNDGGADASFEFVWQRLIRELRLGYRTIIEDVARMDRADLQIFLALAIDGGEFSFDIYANRHEFEASDIRAFPVPVEYSKWTHPTRMRFVAAIVLKKIRSG